MNCKLELPYSKTETFLLNESYDCKRDKGLPIRKFLFVNMGEKSKGELVLRRVVSHRNALQPILKVEKFNNEGVKLSVFPALGFWFLLVFISLLCFIVFISNLNYQLLICILIFSLYAGLNVYLFKQELSICKELINDKILEQDAFKD